MRTDDTIFAPATADAPAARAVVRLCGPKAFDAAVSVAPEWKPAAGSALGVDLRFAGLTCPGWIYCFCAPHSYTGDDTVEFHLPGNAILVRLLCERLAAAGCRSAGPGEFTARAYFSGKINLAEAEGVAATIAAASGAELAAARRLLSGELARRLKPVTDRLAETLALVEAEIDFSDQDVTFLTAGEVVRRVAEIDAALSALVCEAGRIEPAGYPPTVALVGRPNAGKSSLLNALAGSSRAVVSPVAGTTRDVLSADVAVGRGVVRLLDVAGLDAGPSGEIDRRMQEFAGRAIESADRVVFVIEGGDRRPALELDRAIDLTVITKTDLTEKGHWFEFPASLGTGLGVSAFNGDGLDRLRSELDRIVFDPVSMPVIVLNHRHRAAIAEARNALRQVDPLSAELAASDLREGLDSLGEVLGAVTPDDVLGRVFSTFCIGK